MAPNAILDDFRGGPKPRLTPFQRTVRVAAFFSWVIFFVGVLFKIESWPWSSTLTLTALCLLSVLYLFLPTPLFRSKNWNQHLTAHWVAAMMLGFLLGLIARFESWPYSYVFSLVAGFGSLAGLVGVIFFMAKNDLDREDRRFWLSMLFRLALVTILTSGPMARFFAAFLR